MELNIPFADKIMPFLFEKSAIWQNHDGTIEPAPRKYFYRCSDLEIVSSYNSELRGICNYYGLASNFTRLDYFAYLMEYSCLKTLAEKYKSTTSKMIEKYHVKNAGWAIPYNTAKGQKLREFAKYQDCKGINNFDDMVIEYAIRHAGARNAA